jgi:hypothetical protein
MSCSLSVQSSVLPLAFTSSVFIPAQSMPGWLQAFATNQPVTVATNALHGLILGQGALSPGRTVTGQVLRPGLVGRDHRGVRPLAVRLYRRPSS